MDDRSIDKAPSASLDMMALNKTVVNARSVVRKAKSHLINKLVRNVTDLKKKKGSDQHKEKNLKKAQRFLEEIDSMRTLKDDKIFKYALANVAKFEDIAKSTVSPAARAMARLADHRLIQEVVQKFRNEQNDWRDLAAFMLMKQTGRKFKSSKQGDKIKGKKGRKEIEKVNKAENIRASKLMTDVYTQGLFREDEFQKAKETLESESKGELNFLQKRRLKLADEKKEKQKKKLDLQKQQSESSQSNVKNNKVKSNTSDGHSQEKEEKEIEANDSGESEDESDESEQDEMPEKSEVSNSKKNNEVKAQDVKLSSDSGGDDDSDDDDEGMDVTDDDDDEGMDVSDDGSEQGFLENEEDSAEELETSKVNINNGKNKVRGSSEKDKVEFLKSKKISQKNNMEPLKSLKNNVNEKVEQLKSKKSIGKDKVEPLKLMKTSNKSKDCVVKQLDIGAAIDKSDNEEESDVEDYENTDEEEFSKQSKRRKKSKAVPKFITEEAPKSKKLPKDSFFEGGDFESESEGSEKEGSDDDGKESDVDNDDDSQAIFGNRGKIKSMIYDQGAPSRGGYGVGRGRGRGRGGGGSRNESQFKFGGKDKSGKKGKKPFGRGGGNDDGSFSFGSKEVVYKRRNQSIITEEGKTKLVTETKESKPKLHPSWEASRKRKAEQSGGIKAFAGKKISFDDD